MRKTWLKNIGAVALMFGLGGEAFAETYGDFEYALESLCVKITRYTGVADAVSIPNRINDLPVTAIGVSAFASCAGLISVVIPPSVSVIEDYAFYECAGLTSVTIPPSVVDIRRGAFVGCTNLTAIAVDPRNTAYSSLNGVLFDKTGKTLRQYPGGKTGAYIIPPSVTAISASAFASCAGLTGVVIPPSVAFIGDAAFASCAGLTSVVIPPSVALIGWYAFFDCAGLTSIAIPPGVAVIREGAFSGCTGLKSVVIPPGVVLIGNQAFSGCTGLTSVVIPPSVTAIGEKAFWMCGRLTSVTLSRKTALAEDVFPPGARLQYHDESDPSQNKPAPVRELRGVSSLIAGRTQNMTKAGGHIRVFSTF
jgi:hypothetical protein